MDSEIERRLAAAKAADQPRAAGPYSCIVCGAGIRAVRVLRTGKVVYRCRTKMGQHVDEPALETITSMVWCSQECHDQWAAQYRGRIPGPHWPIYDAEGILVAYVIPGRGRVPAEEVMG